MSVVLTSFLGDRDGIRWGRAHSWEFPARYHSFLWVYDALADRVRLFRPGRQIDDAPREFRFPRLAEEVREAAGAKFREALGRAA